MLHLDLCDEILARCTSERRIALAAMPSADLTARHDALLLIHRSAEEEREFEEVVAEMMRRYRALDAH